MRAIRQHAFGGPQELRLEQMPDPHPADGQVRIRVESAGVHLLDTVIRRGEAVPRAMPKLPMTPGREVAGVIDEIGWDVAEPWLGRSVVADLGLASGGYAELALARLESVHDVPKALDADQAVAMIGTGRTTMAILELAPPRPAKWWLSPQRRAVSAHFSSRQPAPWGPWSSASSAGSRRCQWSKTSARRTRSTTSDLNGQTRCAPRWVTGRSPWRSTESAARSAATYWNCSAPEAAWSCSDHRPAR